jgi:hypothetical protein
MVAEQSPSSYSRKTIKIESLKHSRKELSLDFYFKEINAFKRQLKPEKTGNT